MAEIRRTPVEVGRLSHYLRGFIHPRWLFGISSINSSLGGSNLMKILLVILREFPKIKVNEVWVGSTMTPVDCVNVWV